MLDGSQAGTFRRDANPDRCCQHRAIDHESTDNGATKPGARCTVPSCAGCSGWKPNPKRKAGYRGRVQR